MAGPLPPPFLIWQIKPQVTREKRALFADPSCPSRVSTGDSRACGEKLQRSAQVPPQQLRLPIPSRARIATGERAKADTGPDAPHSPPPASGPPAGKNTETASPSPPLPQPAHPAPPAAGGGSFRRHLRCVRLWCSACGCLWVVATSSFLHHRAALRDQGESTQCWRWVRELWPPLRAAHVPQLLAAFSRPGSSRRELPERRGPSWPTGLLCVLARKEKLPREGGRG